MKKALLCVLLLASTTASAAETTSYDAIGKRPSPQSVCYHLQEGEKYEEYYDCINAKGPQSGADLQIAFDRLISLYRRNQDLMNREGAMKALTDSQTKWIAYRDAQCDVDDAVWMTNGIPNVVSCTYQMNLDRIAYLNNLKNEISKSVQ